MADVPLGAFLSGGVDSSLVVALMAEQSMEPVKTFTIGFDDPDYDEGAAASDVAARFGTSHTHVDFTSGEAMALVPGLADMSDEPMANLNRAGFAGDFIS